VIGPRAVTLGVAIDKHASGALATCRDLHAALGSIYREARGAWYHITAYYIIRAPRVLRSENRGPIRFHQAIMVTRVTAKPAAHGGVAMVTAWAFVGFSDVLRRLWIRSLISARS
jgi:hypothetical protein